MVTAQFSKRNPIIMHLYKIIKNRLKLINEKLIELDKKLLVDVIDHHVLAKRQELVKRLQRLTSSVDKNLSDNEQAHLKGNEENLPSLKTALDASISELRENLIRQRMKVVKGKDPFTLKLVLPGLTYEPVLGDGNCFFHAVGLYLGKNQNELRQSLSEYVQNHKDDYLNFMELSGGETPEEYIAGIKDRAWANHLEIEALMSLLQRPILIITPDSKIRNQEDASRYVGDPIFVYYNDENHYDALLQRGGDKTGRDILQDIVHTKPSDKAEVMQLYHELIQLASLSKLRPEEIVASKEQLKQAARLQAQQQAADNNNDFQRALTATKAFAKKHHRKISVFVSYAWPSDDRPYESWVQPFLEKFTEHLEKAHVRVLWDIHSSRFGFNSYEFMDEILESNYVILIGTESLVDKHTKGISSVCNELNRIRERRIKDYDKGQYRVIPLVISGEIEKSLPCEYMRYTVIESFKGGGYTKTIRELLGHVLEIPKDELQQQWKKLATTSMTDSVFSAIDAAQKDYLLEKPVRMVPSQARLAAGFVQRLRELYLSQHGFLSCLFNNRKLPIDTHYVELTIISDTEQREKEKLLTERSDLFTAKQPIKIEEIFDICKTAPSGAQRVVARGRAGIGKSVVCQRMAFQWAKEELWRDRFQAVFWISLRNLTKNNYPTERRYELHEIIHQECFNNQLPEEQYRALEKALKEQSDQFLILADGYDELSPVCTRGYLQSVVKAILSHPHVFLTSRPQVISEIPESLELEVIGFSDENMESFIKKYFDANLAKGLRLIQFLKQSSSMRSIAHIPINLELLCGIWEDNELSDKETPTFTKLYQAMVQSLFRRYLSKERFTPNEIVKVPSRVIDANCHQLPAYLEAIAWRAMEADTIYLPESLILEEIDKVEKKNKNDELTLQEREQQDIERLQLIHYRSGFLRLTAENMHQRKAYFAHLTFQEYFAACYFARIIEESESQPQQYEVMREKFKQYKFNPRFEVVWWFVAGILRDKKDVVLQRFYRDFLFAPQKDLLRQYEMSLLVRCVEESGVPEKRGVRIADLKAQVRNWVRAQVKSVNNEATTNSSGSAFNHPFYNVLAQSPHFTRSANVVGVMSSLLSGSSRVTRQYIVHVLGVLAKSVLSAERTKVVKMLIDVLEEKIDDEIQKIAIRVLGELAIVLHVDEKENVIEVLIAQFGDDDVNVRQHAVRALVKLINSQPAAAQRKSIEMLIGSMKDSEQDVQECAIRLIKRLMPVLQLDEKIKAVKVMLELLEDVTVVANLAAEVSGLVIDSLPIEHKIKIEIKLLKMLVMLDSEDEVRAVRLLGKLMTTGTSEDRASSAKRLIDALVDPGNCFSIKLFHLNLSQNEWLELADSLLTVLTDALTNLVRNIKHDTVDSESDSDDDIDDTRLFKLLHKIVKYLVKSQSKRDFGQAFDPLNLINLIHKVLNIFTDEDRQKIISLLMTVMSDDELRPQDFIPTLIQKLSITLAPNELMRVVKVVIEELFDFALNSSFLISYTIVGLILNVIYEGKNKDIEESFMAAIITALSNEVSKQTSSGNVTINADDEGASIDLIRLLEVDQLDALLPLLDSPDWAIRCFVAGLLMLTIEKHPDITRKIKRIEALIRLLEDSHPVAQILGVLSVIIILETDLVTYKRDKSNESLNPMLLHESKIVITALIKILQNPNPVIKSIINLAHKVFRKVLGNNLAIALSPEEQTQITEGMIRTLENPDAYFFVSPIKLIRSLSVGSPSKNMPLQKIAALVASARKVISQLSAVDSHTLDDYRRELKASIKRMSPQERAVILKATPGLSGLVIVDFSKEQTEAWQELPLLLADQTTVTETIMKDLEDNWDEDSDSDDDGFVSEKLVDVLLPDERVEVEKVLVSALENQELPRRVQDRASSLLKKSLSNPLENEWRIEIARVQIKNLMRSNLLTRFYAISILMKLFGILGLDEKNELIDILIILLKDRNITMRTDAIILLRQLTKTLSTANLKIATALLPSLLDDNEEVRATATNVLKELIDVLPEDGIIKVISALINANIVEHLKLKHVLLLIKFPQLAMNDLRGRAAKIVADCFKKTASPLYFHQNHLCFHEDGVEHRVKVNSMVEAKAFIKVIQAAFTAKTGIPLAIDLPLGETPLHEAVQNENLAEVRRLLDETPEDLNNQNNTERMSALMIAVFVGNLPIVRFLLAKGAELNLFNRRYESAINLALQKSNVPVLCELLRYRPAITLSQLNILLDTHHELYRGQARTRDHDDVVIDKVVAALLGVENISKIKIKERKRYLAHLQSFASLKSGMNTVQELEGFFVEDFLPLRISHYVQLIFDIQHGILLDFDENSKEEVLVALKREILLACETYKSNEESNFALLFLSWRMQFLKIG